MIISRNFSGSVHSIFHVRHPSGQKEKGGNLNAIFSGRFYEKDL
jgi:hypothetical protein